MMLLLPIFSLLLLWSILAARKGGKPDQDESVRWGDGLLGASVILALAVVVTNEVLSLFHALDYTALAIFWTLAVLGAGVVGWKLSFARPPRPSLAFLSSFGWFEKTIVIFLAAMAAILFFIALVALPNTYDSMTYHLARVAHWEQNRSIAFYPTSIMRQNHQPPLAEWLLLQIRILSRSYQLVNLLQWCAMAGSAVGTAMVTRRMGGSSRAVLLAAVFAATLPMGILQATSTQNDYVAGYWLVCFVLFGLEAVESPTVLRLFLMAGSLALALLTKGTMYIFALPFAIWFGVALLRRMGRSAWRAIVISVVVVLVVNGGHAMRNYRVYGNPLGTDREIVDGETFLYRNEVQGIRPTLSNLARNLAIQLAAPIRAWNQTVSWAVMGFHRMLGADPSDPRTTWLHEPFRVTFDGNENLSGNPLHTVMLGIAFVVFIYGLLRKRNRQAQAAVYLCCLVAAAVIFCVMLRWQPWHGRLHLPLLLLTAPFFAILLASLSCSKSIAWLAMAVLVLSALPPVVANPLRPMFGSDSVLARTRREQLTEVHPYDFCLPALDFLSRRRCSEVGLIIHGNGWEFPYWLGGEELYGLRTRYEHVGVNNVTRTLAPPIQPTYVLRLDDPPLEVLTVDGKSYARVFESTWGSVYKIQE